MKTTTKHEAQDRLIQAMQNAFWNIAEGHVGVDADVLEAMGQQFERVERLFGYKPGAFGVRHVIDDIKANGGGIDVS